MYIRYVLCTYQKALLRVKRFFEKRARQAQNDLVCWNADAVLAKDGDVGMASLAMIPIDSMRASQPRIFMLLRKEEAS